MTRSQVIGAFRQSLKTTWIVGAAISAGTLLLVFLEKELKLRTELDTKYGLKDHVAKEKDPENATDGVGEAGSLGQTNSSPTAKKTQEWRSLGK